MEQKSERPGLLWRAPGAASDRAAVSVHLHHITPCGQMGEPVGRRTGEDPILEYEPHGSEVFGPSLDLILRLHRHLEDLVFFGWKRPDLYEDDGVYPIKTLPGEHGKHGAITVRDLKSMFPQFIEDLCRDAYFTINGMLQPPQGRDVARRQSRYVAHLNAVFADLDMYKADEVVTPNVAAGLVLDLVSQGLLPAPSFFSFSGRGVWAFWILRTPDSQHKAPGAYRQRGGPLDLWKGVMKEIQRTLAEHLPQLEVDLSAKDVVRYTRVPGSINTKSGKPVRYLFPAESAVRGYVYTLGELADFFNVFPVLPNKAKRTRKGKALRKPARGRLATWEHRLDEFRRLVNHRGPKLKDGQHRRMTLFWYAFLLRQLNATEEEVWEQVKALAESCSPPVGETIAQHQCTSGYRLKKATNATIAGGLGVTDVEVKALDLHHLRPDFEPKAAKRVPSTKTEDRRRAMLELIKGLEVDGAELPPTRVLAEMLTERGHRASHDTVARDLRELGIAHSQVRARMRRKQERERLRPSLFDPQGDAEEDS